jgi:uncharacterized lipoprotein YddW (UPF0748 family)
MNKFPISLFVIITILGFCINCTTTEPPQNFHFAAWTGADIADTETEWRSKLERFSEYGLTDLYLGANKETLEEVAVYAGDYGINIHGWVWVMNRPGDTTAAKHPEWYAVNRNGQNSYDYRAYVDYYQWLSPFSEGARNHIKNNIKEVATAEGVKSVHLDYVRYVDVILGADLQPKYDIVQDKQFPEYDYGYHPNARKEFEELFGVDPMDMEYPELSTEWLQFRLNAVSTLVAELDSIADSHQKMLTAAVFPFPEMSRQMVRQDWSSWNLDIAHPMLYHNFYRQNLEWIKFATEQGVREVKGRYEIRPGLFVPALTPSELKTAIYKAKAGGATGISLFDINSMKDEHWAIIQEVNAELNN